MGLVNNSVKPKDEKKIKPDSSSCVRDRIASIRSPRPAEV